MQTVMTQTRLVKKTVRWLWFVLIAALFLAGMVGCQVIYSLSALSFAQREGMYATPQEGVAARAKKYLPDYPYLEISRSGPNAFDGSNAHVWYVHWRACKTSGDESLLGRDCTGGGNYYLLSKDGWVYMPEGYLPEMVGFWMKALGLAGIR